MADLTDAVRCHHGIAVLAHSPYYAAMAIDPLLPTSAPFSQRIRLRHLHTFLAVAREQNLGRAADKLALSQPAVSKTLAELEALTGCKLFERGRQGAMLTQDGERFLSHALKILDTIETAGQAFGNQAGAEHGSVALIRVGALPTVAPDVLPGAIAAVRALRPATRIMVQTAANAPLLAQLKAGEIDFAIGRMADPEMMVGLSFELLFVEPLILVVRTGHPLLELSSKVGTEGRAQSVSAKKRSAQTPLSLAEVMLYAPLVSPKGTIPRHNTESFLQSRGIRLPLNTIETLSVSFARRLALSSDHVWFTPMGAVRDDLARGLLNQLPLATVGTEEPVGLLMRSEGRIGAPALELIASIRDIAAQRRG